MFKKQLLKILDRYIGWRLEKLTENEVDQKNKYGHSIQSKERLINKYEDEFLWVLTEQPFCFKACRTNFETRISHFLYGIDRDVNDGRTSITVENYEIIQQARIGHNKWVRIMTSDSLPEYLDDVCTFLASRYLRKFHNQKNRFYKRKVEFED